MNKDKLLHEGFKIGILIKFIDGLLEIGGAFLLFFLSPSRLNQILLFLTQKELTEDSKDFVSNFLISLSDKYSIGIQYFGIIYLLIHGIVKIIIYILLVTKKKGAYLISYISLIGFIIYQTYHYTISHSTMLLLFTILDVILLILVFIEQRRIIDDRKEILTIKR